MKNKKAQVIILKIMLSIIILIMAVAFTRPLKDVIGTSRNTSNVLNCSGTNLTATSTATCVVLDFSLFYFIGIVISVGMAFLAGRKNISGIVTAIVVFVIVNILISPLKEFIVFARDAAHLNCASASISIGARLTCILFDAWLFWFVAVALSAALSFIIAKKVLPE